MLAKVSKSLAERRNSRPRGLLAAITLSAWLCGGSGCTVGPDFIPPQASVPAGWSAAETPPEKGAVRSPESSDAELARWWQVFGDAQLTALEERALSQNLELQQAEARIRQARAARGIALGGLGPALDAGGSFRRSRSPGLSSDSRLAREAATIANVYDAGFDAGWEIDLFGGIRRGVEAADAELRAAVEDRRDIRVSLAAEVARSYIELRSLQQRAAIARGNLEIQSHSARLTRQRFEGGFASGLDVANSEAQVATTSALIPPLEAAARQRIHALGILLGVEPGALIAELDPPAPLPVHPPPAPVGLPSDLLRRRPDIRRAESELHAATARIGVAVAELFPKFTLSGAAGMRAGDFSAWLTWPQRFWSFGPAVSWRLFDTGRTQAAIAQQEALADQAAIAYQRSVIGALREVEDALIEVTKEQERRADLVAAVEANRRAVRLAKVLYTEGQTDFLNVLDAQRSLFLTEESLAVSSAALATGLIAIYKAAGGGWSEAAGESQ
jgi:NodT family efflux transporter outer membrane factor (OMF) lipoprotein